MTIHSGLLFIFVQNGFWHTVIALHLRSPRGGTMNQTLLEEPHLFPNVLGRVQLWTKHGSPVGVMFFFLPTIGVIYAPDDKWPFNWIQ